MPVTLVPVEVFGGDCDCHTRRPGSGCEGWGYGLMDAVEPWSDCNRAEGRIYRVDDQARRRAGDTVTVYVARQDLGWFKREFRGA